MAAWRRPNDLHFGVRPMSEDAGAAERARAEKTRFDMNRAFVNEDAPDGHVFIPPRAPLPPGAVNYVTPRGIKLLREELATLEEARTRIARDKSDEAERTRQLNINRGRTQDLRARIASARIVDPKFQPRDEIRFGATVTLGMTGASAETTEETFQIVGVDEAAAAQGRVAFIAPIVRAILGRKVGETVVFPSVDGDIRIEIRAIDYASDLSELKS